MLPCWSSPRRWSRWIGPSDAGAPDKGHGDAARVPREVKLPLSRAEFMVMLPAASVVTAGGVVVVTKLFSHRSCAMYPHSLGLVVVRGARNEPGRSK